MSQKEKQTLNSNENNIQEINKERKDEKIMQLSKPSFLSNLFVQKPFHISALCMFFFIFSTILTVYMNWFKKSKDTQRDWLVWKNENVIKYDTFNEIQEIFKQQSKQQQVPIGSENVSDWETYIMLECQEDCENVLTVEGLNLLREVEREIKSLKEYQNICLKESNNKHTNNSNNNNDNKDLNECHNLSVISLTKLFLEEQPIENEDIQQNLNFISKEMLFPNFKFMFGKDFTQKEKKSKYLLSIFRFGAPLSINNIQYKSQYDRFDEQQQFFEIFSQNIKKITEKHNKKQQNIQVLVYSKTILLNEIDTIVSQDTMFAIGSILFVWIYMAFHLKSIFLSTFSIFNILMSFPLSMIIFRIILNVDYFASVHSMIIFVVLGIAADDVFVFIDAWNQTENLPILDNDLGKRMAVTFRRAAKAMFATSSTTSAAFLATGLSNIMPISSFGIFASILIPMNFLIVITFFPAILIIYEKKIVKQRKNDEKSVIFDEKLSKIEAFFDGKFNDFVYRFRFLIVVLSFVWVGIALVYAVQIGAQRKPDKWLPESNGVQSIIDHLQDDMHTSGKGGLRVKVNMFWGVEGLDKQDISQWDSLRVGNAIWDKGFDVSREENQVYLYSVCQRLLEESVVLNGDLQCFMIDFKEFALKKRYDFPVKQKNFQRVLEEFVKVPEGNKHFIENFIGIIDNKVKYVGIQLSSIGHPDLSYIELQEIEQQWQNVVYDINEKSPQGINNGQFCSYNFAWMVSQKAFVENAIQGLIISILFSFIVLLLATKNVLISMYSVICILFILISVVCIMQFKGWEIGVAESITIVILNGFSVDYVVHLANHYVESSCVDRQGRIRESLRDIGVSVLSGSITTFGSGLFLYFSRLSMFSKFSAIILTTVGFSVYFSLVFFAGGMHLIGPQRREGGLECRCLKRVQRKIKNLKFILLLLEKKEDKINENE